jgi:hypothetical protein
MSKDAHSAASSSSLQSAAIAFPCIKRISECARHINAAFIRYFLLHGAMCRRKAECKDKSMTRVALYARYSSDNQRDASIEDQFRICKERAMREK